MKLLNLLQSSKQTKQRKREQRYRELIHQEAVIGGTLFGKVPEGRYREFLCIDERTWVWHEEWKDEQGNKVSQTTRYDVRPDGVYKCQNKGEYVKVSNNEAQHLLQAARLYKEKIIDGMYAGIGRA